MKQKMWISVVCLSAVALAAEDRFTLKAPNGIEFSEFRGYETWQYVEPHLTNDRIKIVAANPVMIAAYKDGYPANGKPVPEGAILAKIEWSRKGLPEIPSQITVAGDFKTVAFMVKDSKRFPDTNGWGYAQFDYDAASGAFKPYGTDASFGKTCHQCHTLAKAKDFVFTAYPVR